MELTTSSCYSLKDEEEEEEEDERMDCSQCSPEEERRIVEELTQVAKSSKKPGDFYYLLSNRWYMKWRRYTEQALGERPGEIDNSHLCVKRTCDTFGDQVLTYLFIEQGRDYVLLPQQVWNNFYLWYKGGPELPRRLICDGGSDKEFDVEIHPLRFRLIDSRNRREFLVQISKKATVRDFYNKVCTHLELDQREVRIWDYIIGEKVHLLDVCDRNLEEYKFAMNHRILLENQIDGKWPLDSEMDSNENALVVEPTRYNSSLVQDKSSCPPFDIQDDDCDLLSMEKGAGRGLVGLRNLGNTCFLNSAIQCLVHTIPLVDYFLNDYMADINKDNPLGNQGELAIAFGKLLTRLWTIGWESIPPHAFKRKLAHCTEQFNGLNQHDSHEFLAFLLDGLHEDLNRVKKKIYVESKVATGRPDEEVANEYWENHKARDDSIIVDAFHGQYKSILVCPVCKKDSVKFEPFTCLQLPLPMPVTREMTITVVYGDGSAPPMSYTVKVQRQGSNKDLIKKLNVECCLRSNESLLLAVIDRDNDAYWYLNPVGKLSDIEDYDHIVAYRLPAKQEGPIRLEIVHSMWTRRGLERWVLPFVTYLANPPRKGTDILAAARVTLKPFLKSERLMNIYNYESRPEDLSVDDLKRYGGSDEELPFRLYLLSGNNKMEIPVEDIHRIGEGGFFRVLLEWSGEESDLYDVSILNNLPVVYTVDFTPTKAIEGISLYSCLEEFLKEEPLGNDDMWYCSICKEHRPATKKLDLWRLPEIFVVHLKRFSSDEYGYRKKLTAFVEFPIHDLDLRKYIKGQDSTQPHVYELYAMINHWGGLNGGHYTACVKVEEHKNWYHFDDDNVTPVEEDIIKTPQAYVLFYKKC